MYVKERISNTTIFCRIFPILIPSQLFHGDDEILFSPPAVRKRNPFVQAAIK